MGKLKLVYADFRGRAEVARLILFAKGVEFEDYRFDSKEFDKEKMESPNQKLPYLVIDDKIKVPQSGAICTYLARQHGLYGSNDLEGLFIGTVYGECVDMLDEMVTTYFEKDPARKTEREAKLKESIPKFLGIIEMYIKKNDKKGYCVGDSLTMADLAVFDITDSLLKHNANNLDDFPGVKEVRATVQNYPQLQKYLTTRKDSP